MIFSRHTIPNAVAAAARVVKSLVKPGDVTLADKDVVTERVRRCEGCWRFEPRSRQCLSCTCFVDIKTLLATESCPEAHWRTQTLFSSGL